PLRLSAEREPDRRLDAPAVADRDDILAGVLDIDALNRATDPVVEVHVALTARRSLIDTRIPMAAERAAGEERGAVHPLPLTKILFGETGILDQARRPWKAGGPDRFRRLMGSHQIARVPHRLARQDLCHRLEHLAVAGVAGDVFLAVDVAAVIAYRRMTD